MPAKKVQPIERGPYKPLLVVKTNGGLAEVACGSCGKVLGTNLGRCLACFVRLTDARLARQFDRIACEWVGQFVDIGQREMAQIQHDHGSLLIAG